MDRMSWAMAIILVLGIIALKWWHRTAEVEALFWVLRPTVQLVSWISGEVFVPISGQGFWRVDGVVLINKDCAGINFLVISLAATWSQALPLPHTWRVKVCVIALCLVAPYLLTLVANTARILAASQFLRYTGIWEHLIAHRDLHLWLCSFVYLFFLVVFFLGLQRGMHVIRRAK
jgi:exosortase K